MTSEQLEQDVCYLKFSVQPGYERMVQNSLDRISEATGCFGEITDDGIPVTYEPAVVTEEGNPVCGATHVVYSIDWSWHLVKSVKISTDINGCEPQRTTTHELLHAFAPEAGHETEGCNGALAPHAPGVIKQCTLDMFCHHAECVNPKAEK